LNVKNYFRQNKRADHHEDDRPFDSLYTLTAIVLLHWPSVDF